ncbi:MAG: LamG domain-containing protein [Chitinophagales bacterium]|nr:LamG domain-containing protein [Chitinophagales bacterium]
MKMNFKIYITTFICFLIFWGNIYSQKLVAYYPFDNESAEDISSNKNNGKLIGSVTSYNDRFGNPCGALYFNGKNSCIEVPNSKSLESITDYMSVSVWFYIDKTSYNNVMRDVSIICKADNSDETESSPQYRVQILQMAKQSVISINTEFTRNDTDFLNHSIEFDKWNFVCVTYNGNEVKMYLNGKIVWSNPYIKSFIKNNSSLFIGKDPPGGMEYFRGAFDDLKIYNGVLSPQQITTMYNDKSNNVVCEDSYLPSPAQTSTTSNVTKTVKSKVDSIKIISTSTTHKAGNDTLNYQYELSFNSCTLTAIMYDDAEEDNDTISVYFNGKIIVDYQMIYRKKNKPIVKLLELNSGSENILASKAWNNGKIPPNTLKIEFYEGDWTQNLNKLKYKKPIIEKVIHSKPGLAGAIKLKCKEI